MLVLGVFFNGFLVKATKQHPNWVVLEAIKISWKKNKTIRNPKKKEPLLRVSFKSLIERPVPQVSSFSHSLALRSSEVADPLHILRLLGASPIEAPSPTAGPSPVALARKAPEETGEELLCWLC